MTTQDKLIKKKLGLLEPAAFEFCHPDMGKHSSVNACSPKPGPFGAVFVDFTALNKAEARVEVNREGGTEFRILFPAPRLT